MTNKIKSVIIEDFIWDFILKNPWQLAFFLAEMSSPVQRHPSIPVVHVERCRRDTCCWSLHKEITKISNDSQTFSDVLRYSQMFPSVPRCSQMFPSVPRCSQMFPDVPRWSQMIPNVLNFFDVFPTFFNIFCIWSQVSPPSDFYSKIRYHRLDGKKILMRSVSKGYFQNLHEFTSAQHLTATRDPRSLY
jgi:hypothetical protein